MDDGDLAVAAEMGMRVDVIRLAVGSPAGVADAYGTFNTFAALDYIAQDLQSALGLFKLKLLIF